MKVLKKMIANLVALGAMMAMLASPAKTLSAADYCCDTGGYGYQECRRSPCIAPTIALGTIALIAIIAVAVQNSGHSHGHCHN